MKKITLLLGTLLLVGCSLGKTVKTENQYPIDPDDQRRIKHGKLLGEEGFVLFGGGKKKHQEEGTGTGIGVNSVLWRAALDTLSFMPLASADPFGGVIITDWYEDPAKPNERFKLNVLILDSQLRADAVRVSVFKQARNGAGEWKDTTVAKSVGTELEDKILTRAREMRVKKMAL